VRDRSQTPLDPPRAKAFREIYSAHAQYVWRALRRLGARASDQEDLLQEVFLRALRSLDSLDAGRPVRPWLFGIAFRVASDHRRLSRHRLEVLQEPLDRADVAPAALEALERSEASRLLHRALQDIPLEGRALLLMFYFDDCTMTEIAQVFPMPVQTLYTRLRRARQQLLEAVRRRQGAERVR
jgi:RNA polymerase sigma-70 factor (ECF subfamily)